MRYLSLFSGMEAATIAWRPLGWECVGVSEIDPAACAVLRHRLPGVPNLGSVTEITDADIAALGPIDVVIGGSPCQDLSVAGKRAGLAGARSNLFHEQLRIFNAARTLCGARWLIWENVPGAFSSNKGRDFAVVVGAMAGCELPVPADGWGSEGVALGDNGFVEWAVLDSQWFGVAQRRRRVFAVLDAGDWANRPPVLLEPESMRGDSAPRRETGEGTARSTGLRTGSGGWPADVASTLNASFGDKQGLEDQHALSGASLFVPAVCGTLTARSVTSLGLPEVYGGMYVPVTAAAITASMGDGCLGHNKDENVFAFNNTGHGFWQESDIAATVRSGDASGGGGARESSIVAFAQNQRDEVRQMEVAGALAAEPGTKQQTYLQQGMAVRRLTPRECEILQSAPVDWTLVPNDRGKPMADGPRYRMCGNSFTATVIRWIGRRLEVAHAYGKQLKGAA